MRTHLGIKYRHRSI